MFKFSLILFAVLSVLCVTECCQQLWYNQCTSNLDCCSGVCFMGDDNGWPKGICKPSAFQTDAVISSSKYCHQLWYNHCTSDSDCCSGFCFMGNDKNWPNGVCSPRANSNEVRVQPQSTTCRADWNNQCRSNDECCSRICYKGSDWLLGICQPAKSTYANFCLDLESNCLSSTDCCSGYCESDLLYGVCRDPNEIRKINVVIPKSVVDYCDTDSLKCIEGERHVACSNNGNWLPTCRDPVSVEMTDEIKKALLGVHNIYRNKIAKGEIPNYDSASNMATIEWDDTLAKFAEMNVRKCEITHDECMNTVNHYPVGQNLAFSASPELREPVKRDPSDIARMAARWVTFEEENGAYYGWMNMINSFDLGSSYTKKYEVLHFTQYLQARANKIGCAVSSSLKEIGERDWRVTWLACNYSFGNLKTFPVYKSGAPASACKTGPNPKYSGLCSPAEQYPHVF